MINLGKEVYLTLEMIESSNLGLFNRFDGIELFRFEMHAFTYATVASFAQDGGKDVVMAEDV